MAPSACRCALPLSQPGAPGVAPHILMFLSMLLRCAAAPGFQHCGERVLVALLHAPDSDHQPERKSPLSAMNITI